MSQYFNREGVVVPLPVTLVGPLALARAAAELADCVSDGRFVVCDCALAPKAQVIITAPRRISWNVGLPMRCAPYPCCDAYAYANAMTSISTSTSFGSRATSTVERAGGEEGK